MGLSARLLSEAVGYAKNNGTEIVESYPVQPAKQRIPDLFAFTGLCSRFKKQEFQEVVCRKKGRPVMRFYLKE